MKTNPTSRLDNLLAEITPLEQAKTNARMQIAARIADAMRAKGWKNKDLLTRVGKEHPSVISKWLSGTHNFTIDTLVELELALDISLLSADDHADELIAVFHASAVQFIERSNPFDSLKNFNYNSNKFEYSFSVNFKANQYLRSH